MADTYTDQFYAGEGFHGYGSQLLVGDGTSPENFDAVAFIKTITPGEMSTAVIDKTHLRSPFAHREKLAGLRDSGPFTIQGFWAPSNGTQNNAGDPTITSFASGGLLSFWIDRTTRNFRIKCSDADTTTFPFTGFVSKFQPGEIGTEDAVMFTAEITPVSDFSADLP